MRFSIDDTSDDLAIFDLLLADGAIYVANSSFHALSIWKIETLADNAGQFESGEIPGWEWSQNDRGTPPTKDEVKVELRLSPKGQLVVDVVEDLTSIPPKHTSFHEVQDKFEFKRMHTKDGKIKDVPEDKKLKP